MRTATIPAIVFCLAAGSARAATLPAGFSETLVAGGLTNPTAMQFAPDGRLFVCEQGGTPARHQETARCSPTPFVTLTVDSAGERGLLGVAFDPAVRANHFVYVYYTATTPAVHNRISRFTANGDVAVAGSEAVIFELDNLSAATNHNGGALTFGPDGKLYVAVGENANGANSQSLTNVLGKMLRINSDGTIPADNPFFATATGRNRAIWALGLRNPFTFAFNAGTGPAMFINDVGQNTWEEIDDGDAGANYGWPTTEGPTTDPRFVSPRYAYDHSSGTVCHHRRRVLRRRSTVQFPADYLRRLLLRRFLRRLDPHASIPATGNAVTTFATGITSPVDLKVCDDGALYYLARGAGAVFRVQHDAPPPPPPPPPTGNGLLATYFDNIDFTGATVTRIDPTVEFVWGAGSPSPSIAPDTFTARWLGQVQPQFSEVYTFYTQSDDGVRLWVNGQLLVDNWTNHATTENSGTIALAAGQKVRHPHRVLRERRQRDSPPVVEQRLHAEGDCSAGAVVCRGVDRRRRSHAVPRLANRDSRHRAGGGIRRGRRGRRVSRWRRRESGRAVPHDRRRHRGRVGRGRRLQRRMDDGGRVARVSIDRRRGWRCTRSMRASRQTARAGRSTSR